MGGAEASTLKLNPSSFCDVCTQNAPKYKCPGCSIRTCCLSCVKSHKEQTNCNGKRCRTNFVRLSEFDDNLLLSDYILLEEAKGAADSAKRMRHDICKNYCFRLPFHLKLLRDVARRRRTGIWILPGGMLRREMNQSRFDRRRKCILWTVEWQFHSTSIILIDHGVNENATLSSAIQKHLKPSPWNHPLSAFCKEQLDHLKFFIRKRPKGRSPLYREMDINTSIRNQLAGITLLEYPTVQVFLSSHTCDFKVEKFSLKVAPAKMPVGPQDIKDVTLIEERKEETDGYCSSDIQIIDLMKYGVPEPLDIIPEEFIPQNKDLEIQVTPPKSCSTMFEGYKGLGCGFSMHEFDTLDGSGFEFGQDLRDAYSGLVGQVNTDEYLCADDGVVKGEIEEGEIIEP